MKKQFNPERLIMARKYRGLSRMELAEKLNISVWELARYENGETVPKTEMIFWFSQQLEFPFDFFCEPSLEMGKVIFSTLELHSRFRNGG
jgi:transcriptional regulator with XRE-family HTH domain